MYDTSEFWKGLSRRFVYTWMQRFLEKGPEGLANQPGRGSHCVPAQPALKEQHDVSASRASAYEVKHG